MFWLFSTYMTQYKTVLTYCSVVLLIYVTASSEQMCNTKEKQFQHTFSIFSFSYRCITGLQYLNFKHPSAHPILNQTKERQYFKTDMLKQQGMFKIQHQFNV